MMPVWLQIAVAVMVPVETFAFGLLLWYAKVAYNDRKAMITRLDSINGSVKKNTWWIEGHEKYTTQRDRELDESIKGLEDRERARDRNRWE